jgi:hypothetical protein
MGVGASKEKVRCEGCIDVRLLSSGGCCCCYCCSFSNVACSGVLKTNKQINKNKPKKNMSLCVTISCAKTQMTTAVSMLTCIQWLFFVLLQQHITDDETRCYKAAYNLKTFFCHEARKKGNLKYIYIYFISPPFPSLLRTKAIVLEESYCVLIQKSRRDRTVREVSSTDYVTAT